MKRNIRRRIVNIITNLRFSIILLLLIAAVTMIGTVIEQEKSLDFYQNNYPITQPVFGFLSWKVIVFFGIDHLYSNVWFYSLMLLFASSLLACTFSTQFPLLKVARTWKFLNTINQFNKLPLNISINKLLNKSRCTLSLNKKGYFVFQQKYNYYAYKGLVGRVSPIFVHFSLICILIGAVVSSFTGFVVQEVVPQGEYFHVQNLISAGNLSYTPQNLLGKVDDFRIAYNENGSINQFFSTLSIQNSKGDLVKQDTIYVNKPLKYQGTSIYQTDWNINGIQISVDDIRLQLSALPNFAGDEKSSWITSFRVGQDPLDTYFFVIRGLGGEVDVYTNDFSFLFTEKVGSSFMLKGLKIQIVKVIASTGLQIKSDPGIPIVYIGFFFLILSTFLSYLTYSQIWLQPIDGQTNFGGTSNRDVVNFEEEFYLLFNSSSKKEKSL
uniref:Cytochrome c biogenesis protein CcsB n=1 Tax=Erythrotrichia carnea TaxID=35151 RepID=A0A1C9CEE8_9RHOD|nr:c-type cytochrome biogenensis protein [Erythrotrichia carnea]AOM66737.1 c-type cytochrome biogenensis protein [Erythrotrichia carnea]